mmetsp:Transcript_30250/g.90075  ORF Transcript_30250/g.90075 Transcript_30250/m.90075 type:complete len:641 (+) Transcript_30250:1414-3336(+)
MGGGGIPTPLATRVTLGRIDVPSPLVLLGPFHGKESVAGGIFGTATRIRSAGIDALGSGFHVAPGDQFRASTFVLGGIQRTFVHVLDDDRARHPHVGGTRPRGRHGIIHVESSRLGQAPGGQRTAVRNLEAPQIFLGVVVRDLHRVLPIDVSLPEGGDAVPVGGIVAEFQHRGGFVDAAVSRRADESDLASTRGRAGGGDGAHLVLPFAGRKSGARVHHGLGTTAIIIVPQRLLRGRDPVKLHGGPRLDIHPLSAFPSVPQEALGTPTFVIGTRQGGRFAYAPRRRGAVVAAGGGAGIDRASKGGTAGGSLRGMSRRIAASVRGCLPGTGRGRRRIQRGRPRIALSGFLQPGEEVLPRGGSLAILEGGKQASAPRRCRGTHALVRTNRIDAHTRIGALVSHVMTHGQRALVRIQNDKRHIEALRDDPTAFLVDRNLVVFGGGGGASVGTDGRDEACDGTTDGVISDAGMEGFSSGPSHLDVDYAGEFAVHLLNDHGEHRRNIPRSLILRVLECRLEGVAPPSPPRICGGGGERREDEEEGRRQRRERGGGPAHGRVAARSYTVAAAFTDAGEGLSRPNNTYLPAAAASIGRTYVLVAVVGGAARDGGFRRRGGGRGLSSRVESVGFAGLRARGCRERRGV